MATFLPPPLLFPSGLRPRDWAAAHGLPFKLDPDLIEPNSAAESPEEARTESSAASSMSRRMFLTERKIPGSIGGGVAFPGFGGGNGGGKGIGANVLRGESGGEKSTKPCDPRSRCLVDDPLRGGNRVSGPVSVWGSRLRDKRESRSSTGS
jgi:hypothetical protein